MMVLQLHQLDSEVLQHAQDKAQRFAFKGNKVPRSAQCSEGDPFADAGPRGQYNNLPSDSEEDAGKMTDRSVPLTMLLRLSMLSGVYIMMTVSVRLPAPPPPPPPFSSLSSVPPWLPPPSPYFTLSPPPSPKSGIGSCKLHARCWSQRHAHIYSQCNTML